MNKWGPFILLLALAFAGCAKKEPPAPPPPPVVEAPPPVPRKLPEPGIEFADAAKQQRYEAHFREYLTVFEAPQAGSPLWLKLKDGRRVVGRVASVGDDYVSINTTGVVAQIRASDLAMESRAQIFLADFAREHAIERMNAESAAPAASPPVTYVRYALGDNIILRTGPGREFRQSDARPYVRGKPIKIRGETNDWLEVQTAPDATPQWILRFATYDLDELTYDARKRELDLLQNIGLVDRIRPEENEVEVDPAMWFTSDDNVRYGIARAMAAYCAAAQKKQVIFVTVLNRDTKEKLGKYGNAMGWMEVPPP